MMGYKVYRHTRSDNNDVFYIGISKKDDRPYSKHQRNKSWLSVFDETGFDVDIIASDLSYSDAEELECLLIKEYGRKDLNNGLLANEHGGGESYLSIYGREFTAEHKKNLSINSGVALRVYNTKTKKTYNSISEASKDSKYSMSHLKNMLKGIRTNKTSFVWA